MTHASGICILSGLFQFRCIPQIDAILKMKNSDMARLLWWAGRWRGGGLAINCYWYPYQVAHTRHDRANILGLSGGA